MYKSKDLLNGILKITQTGQDGIRSMVNFAVSPMLRRALEDQFREYRQIEYEAGKLACQRGWELQEADPAVRFVSGLSAGINLRGRNSDLIIAGRMIRRNKMNMDKGHMVLEQLPSMDNQVYTLFQRLLDCQADSNRKMEKFL